MKKSSHSTAHIPKGEAVSFDADFDVMVETGNSSGSEDHVLECPPDLVTAFTNNMAVCNHQRENQNIEEEKFKGGIDTLRVSLAVEWNERFLSETSKLLDDCQFAAKAGDESRQYFRIGDQLFRVFATGAGRGKGVFRHVIVEGSGIHFEFSKCSAPGDDYFNAVVTIGSVTCNSVPLDSLWQRVQLFFKCLGGNILANRVSRVDPYVDAADVPLSWAMAAWHEGKVICRARSFAVYGDRQDAQTLTIGSGTFIRIYNKLAELQAKPDVVKANQIAEKFGGTLPEVLTRFEFQCVRRFLRDLEIHTIQDLMCNLNSLGSYLTRSWFRVSETRVDRHHTERFSCSTVWETIASTFEKLSEDSIKNLVRTKQTVRNPNALVRQAVGCMLKAVHGDVLSIAGFLAKTHETFRQAIRDLGEKKFYSRLAKCHATGLVAQSDTALSGPPKFVTAEGVMKRLRAFYGKRKEQQSAASYQLYGPDLCQEWVGECWPEECFNLSYPEEYVF